MGPHGPRSRDSVQDAKVAGKAAEALITAVFVTYGADEGAALT